MKSRTFLLLLISFIEGGIVMVIELIGAKIISPFYGTSLYVWSSVLGVTLGSLAFGYFFGGYISFKYPKVKSLFVILMIGAFFTAIAPITAPWIMQSTQHLGLKLGSFLSTLLFLFPPIACMGMVSPLIIQYINHDTLSAGSSAGKVYAISTVGGILATFLTGFYLIPEWGIQVTAYLVAAILFIISIIYFLRIGSLQFLSSQIVLMMAVLIIQPNYNLKSSTTEILEHKVGILGEWQVVDYNVDGSNGEIQKERRLLLNGIDQTYTQVGYEPLSLWTYPHKLGAYASIKEEGSKALLLGMGGGSVVHELVSLGLDVDVVELDENVVDISTDYFNFNVDEANVFIDDARHYIKDTREKYDIVIIDLVLGEVQPAHVFSLEGFQDLKKILNDDALVIINFQGNLQNSKGARGPLSICKTLAATGFHVDHYFNYDSSSENQTQDIFVLASMLELDFKTLFDSLRYNDWFEFDDFDYYDLISETELNLEEGIILVDDKPKLELINAESIIEWRKNKIEQNIKRMLDQNLRIY